MSRDEHDDYDAHAEHAERLLLELLARFPRPKVRDATAAAYLAELVSFHDEQAAAEAVALLIDGEDWLPSVRLLRETYRARRRARAAERARRSALVEPPPDRVANIARARAYLARLRSRAFLDEEPPAP
jgi:hypothetical protein